MNTLRVLLHAPTADALARARANATNFLAAEPDATVEIVVNAQGARAAVENANDGISELIRYCANSLEKQGLDAPPDARIVPSAVVYLAECQADGWAYIRC